MIFHVDELRSLIAKEILLGIAHVFGSEVEASLNELDLAKQLQEPPPPHPGDFAFACFGLSKHLKQSPAVISQKLAEALKGSELFKGISAGPYLNIEISSKALSDILVPQLLDRSYFKKKLVSQAPKTMFEYSQPNTHKELHVGHCRNACLGDSLVRLHKACGFDVVSSTFPGDVGTHVAKCLWYLTHVNQETPPETGKGEWLGSLYSKASILIEDESKTPKGEQNQILLTEILKQLEKKQGKYFDLWKETRVWSIDLMKEIYGWMNVSFDHWYFESDVDSASVEYVKKLFQEGKLEESQGAIGYNLEAENLGFCLLLKKDGNGLYATKDLELARRKFQDFNIEKSYYVVDVRQSLHFQQVFKVLEKVGFEQAKNCVHLGYNFVELPDGPMSSRKGNIIPLIELIQQMESHIIENYLSRHSDAWQTSEIKETAKMIAQGAIKYGMLKIDPNKKIIFDMKEWLKIEGDSGPFIQMSVARAKSILRKSGVSSNSNPFNSSFDSADFSLMTTLAERNLIKWFLFFQSTVLASTLQAKPSLLCHYLYSGAQAFNTFYHECPIGSLENESLKKARLTLSQCFVNGMEEGLKLIGVGSPERM